MIDASQTPSLSRALRKFRRAAFAPLLLAGAAILAACGAHPEDTTVDAPLAQQAGPQGRAHHGHGQGVARIFSEALEELTLTPQQRQTIEQLRTDLRAKAEPMHEAGKKLKAAVAAQVAQGAIDPNGLVAPRQELERAVAAFKPALEDAMNKLHATLDAGQRKALIESLKDKMGHRREAMAEGRGGPHKMGDRLKMMKKMADDLGLSDEQRETIRENMRAGREQMADKREEMKARRDEMREKHRKMSDAFQSESFDAHALDLGKEIHVNAGQNAERGLQMLSKIVAVLTPEQRAKLSERMQRHELAGPPAASDDDGDDDGDDE